jgi:hypothetical protein
MADDNPESLVNLLVNGQSNDDQQMSEKVKTDYEAIHLPLSIIEMLKTWRRNSLCEKVNNRVGVSPCDEKSLDGMFIHIWGESHIEQPSRLTSIINYFHDY